MKPNRSSYHHVSNLFLTALALGLVLLMPAPLKAQTTATAPRQDNDTTQRQLADMDHFLDGHPEIAEQLRKDPSLINNKEFVANHPTLQQWLQEHPGVREEVSENPNAFMRQEERYDRREDRYRGDRDTTRQELASMDRFLDSHSEIAEQLRKDPSLVNNAEFVANHPALQQYLQQHPGVREEITENPNAFMRQEQRYDRREDATSYRDRDRDRDRMTTNLGDRDRDGGEMSSFGEFLRGHSTVADQLSKDPTLANNKEFLASHPELQDYLKDHPGVQQQLTENPQAVMTSPGLASNPTFSKTPSPNLKPKDKQ